MTGLLYEVSDVTGLRILAWASVAARSLLTRISSAAASRMSDRSLGHPESPPDPAQVGTVQAGTGGEFLLRPVALRAFIPKVAGDRVDRARPRSQELPTWDPKGTELSANGPRSTRLIDGWSVELPLPQATRQCAFPGRPRPELECRDWGCAARSPGR